MLINIELLDECARLSGREEMTKLNKFSRKGYFFVSVQYYLIDFSGAVNRQFAKEFQVIGIFIVFCDSSGDFKAENGSSVITKL